MTGLVPLTMVGKTLGHYRILEKIGAGGMGEVYRARDERLERDVAIKVLPAGTLADETARKRFRKEALTLSQLNHPNIAVVYDFDTQDGVDFLAMEYVAGETLTERLAVGALPEKEVVGIATQIAEALEEAHERDIVHRDLKPGNVMVTSKGRVRVLDFGLAKLVRPVEENAATAESLAETQAGAVMGTVPYMAPEQLQGKMVDARADIYGLGTVLYEMATGRRPFPETQTTQLIAAILTQPPRRPRELNGHVSPGLESIILKALEKKPEQRYQSAEAVLEDLRRLNVPGSAQAWVGAGSARTWEGKALPSRRVGAAIVLALIVVTAILVGLNVGRLRERLLGHGGPPRIESIAVLPLENFSRDPEQEYFTDGMTEELITNLAKIGALKVISRTSVMHFKGTRKTVPEIAKELNVDAVVEGSVERSGSRVRITAQLIQAATDRHLWAESYERDLKDVLALQDEVARAIAGEIKVTLTPQEQTSLAGARPVNTQAYQSYLRGRFFWRKFTAADIAKSIDYYQQAIEFDPNYAPAYAGLADAYALGSVGGGGKAPKETIPKAREAARKALELDSSLGEAHLSLALVRTYYDRDWLGADQEFKRAIELNPSYAEAHHFYSHYYVALGRIADSLIESKRALELDPLSPDLAWHLGWHYFYARQYEQAIAQLKKALESSPKNPMAHLVLGLAFEQEKMVPESIAEYEKVQALAPGTPFGLTDMAHAYAVSGNKTQARNILDELKQMAKQRYVSSSYLAVVYTGLGEKEQAFEALHNAFEEHSYGLATLKMDPRLDPLRSDPRFQELLARLGLPP